MFNRALFIMAFGLPLAACAATGSQSQSSATAPPLKNVFMVTTDKGSVAVQIDLDRKELTYQKTEDGICQQWQAPIDNSISSKEPFIKKGKLLIIREKARVSITPSDLTTSATTPCAPIPVSRIYHDDKITGDPAQIAPALEKASTFFNIGFVTDNDWEYPCDGTDFYSESIALSPIFSTKDQSIIGASLNPTFLDYYISDLATIKKYPDFYGVQSATLDGTKGAYGLVHFDSNGAERERHYNILTRIDYRRDNVRTMAERKALYLKYLNQFNLSMEGVQK